MKILIVGPTSFLARPLVGRLAEAGHEVRLLTRDPRRIPEEWRRNFACHYGTPAFGHILYEALEGCDRVVLALAPGLRPPVGDGPELEGCRLVLEAARRLSCGPIVKLSSWGPGYSSAWWAMRARREADSLLSAAPHPTTVVRVGWIAENLLEMIWKGVLWIPGPAPGRLHWIAQSDAVEILAQAVEDPAASAEVPIVGREIHSLGAAAAMYIAHAAPGLRKIVVPWKVLPLLRRVWPIAAFLGERVRYGCALDEPEPGEDACRYATPEARIADMAHRTAAAQAVRLPSSTPSAPALAGPSAKETL